MSLLKSILLGALSVLGLPRDRAVILMYHSVSADSDEFMNVSPSVFEAHMRHLARTGITVVSLSELVRRLRSGERLGGVVAITFDDGYEDNYTKAFPVLRKYRFPATIFVTTGLIDSTDTHGRKRLTTAQMLEMKSSGLIDIEPHTVTHPKLGALLATEVIREMEESRTALGKILGTTPQLFAYPFGNHTIETAGLAQARGFEAAFTIKEGLVHANQNPWRLPRVSIDRSTTLSQFRGKITRAVDVYESLKSMI